jgi:hypothetical protein
MASTRRSPAASKAPQAPAPRANDVQRRKQELQQQLAELEKEGEPAETPAPKRQRAEDTPAEQQTKAADPYTDLRDIIRREIALATGATADLPEGASAGGGYVPLSCEPAPVRLPTAFGVPGDGTTPLLPAELTPQRIESGDAPSTSRAPDAAPKTVARLTDVAPVEVARAIAQRALTPQQARERLDHLLQAAKALTGAKQHGVARAASQSASSVASVLGSSAASASQPGGGSAAVEGLFV